jgi:hypothetical protein
MAHSTKSLARMQQGVDNLTEFDCHNVRGCFALSRMGTGILREPYKTEFNAGLWDRKIDYVVYSYQTPIGWHTTEGVWTVPDTRYSVTTTNHQRTLRTAIDNPGFYGMLHEHVSGTRVL